MLQVSLGLRNRFLDQAVTQFALGAIYVYTGAQPDNAEMPPTGTLVGVISNAGGVYNPTTGANGLRVVNTGNGYITFDPSQSWVLRGVATGTAGWARFVAKNDTATYSTSQPRIDCGINAGESALYLDDPAITAATRRNVGYWIYGIPPFAGSTPW